MINLLPNCDLLLAYSVTGSIAPYPQSQLVTKLTWDKEVIKLRDGAGDNWPITWVDDDIQITALGDGNGFSGQDRHLTLGFARIIGNPPNHTGEDLVSDADTPEGGGSSGIKASGILMVDGTLYMLIRNYRLPNSDDFTNSRLALIKNRAVSFSVIGIESSKSRITASALRLGIL